jgi:hypothetical protein
MKMLVAIALCLLPLAAPAADEPEGVFAKYHRAAMASDLNGLLEYSVAGQRADMKAMSPANREMALAMVKAMMPRLFAVERKTLESDNRATLIVSGPWDGGPNGRVQVYGTVRLLMENAEWKVIGAGWSTEKPEALTTKAAPAPQADGRAIDKAPDKSGKPAPVFAAKGGAPVVGSMESGSVGRKLGAAKPECVYKPVMTAQDMENCK